MKYDYQISSRKKKRFLKKLYVFLVIIFVLAVVSAIFIRIDTYLQSRKNTPDQTTTEPTTAFFDAKDKVYRTQLFQFQTKNSWTEIPAESNGNKYVYRNLNGQLIEEEINIYVNKLPSNLPATRVLPVNLLNKSQLEPLDVSDHCVKALNGQSSSRDQEVSLSGATMLCDSDGSQYEVLVGLKGGSTKLTLERPDGTEAAYMIFYRNVKATPNETGLLQIISSFQTR